MQLDRRDVELMLAIAAGGSLAEAARRLELAPTVVSKRLAAWSSANRASCQGVRWLSRVSPCT